MRGKNLKKNIYMCIGLPQWLSGKEFTGTAGTARGAVSVPGSGRSPWKRATATQFPVFLPGKSHGQRSLAVYSL